MTRLTGKDLEEVRDLMRQRNGGEPASHVQVEAALCHLHHGGDILDLAPVEEMLEGDADLYAAWVVSFLEAYPPTAADADGQTIRLAHPAKGMPKSVTVRQLKGRDMDLALHNHNRAGRLALMTGLSAEQLQKMDLADVFGLESAAAPFLTRVLRALSPGGTTPAGS